MARNYADYINRQMGNALLHYEMSEQEMNAESYHCSSDPPRMLCRTGDGHARGTRNELAVTCPACNKRLDDKTGAIKP